MKNFVARAMAVVAIGIAASACSSVPDWVDPTTWDDSKSAPADNGKATDLADIPNRPATTTPDEQKQVADSLAADRAKANYSAEELRAGNEPSAPPPPPPAPASEKSDTVDTSSAKSDKAAAPPPDAKPDSESKTAASEPATAPAPAEQQTAAAAPAPQPAASGDAGFNASSAPPLDPAVAQMLPPSTVAKYQQSTNGAAVSSQQATNMAGPSAQTVPSAVASGAKPDASIQFSATGVAVTRAGQASVKEIVQAYQAKGSIGFVRVVGHSSGGTAKLTADQRQKLAFQRSQARANAVAHALIKAGVPADKVLTEAVGETQPVSNGAEIFLQP